MAPQRSLISQEKLIAVELTMIFAEILSSTNVELAQDEGGKDDRTESRRVVIVWRKSFTRKAAIDALCEAIANIQLPGVTPLGSEATA